MDCSYCYAKNSYITNRKKILGSIDAVLKKNPKITNLTITGGEPLLEYNFLIELFTSFRNQNFKKFVITNGFFLDDQKVGELARLGAELRMSIDSFSVGEKVPNQKQIKLIKDFGLRYCSKVITRNNLKYSYEDFIGLVELGFIDIDVIPQMYSYWSDEEIDLMIHEIRKIIRFSLDNNININLLGMSNKSNRYYDCDKIRILPDGDISFCNSLNCIKKTYFVSPQKLDEFWAFKQKIVSFAKQGLLGYDWFKEEDLCAFCMVDAFYYTLIKKDNKWLSSAVKLFVMLNKVVEAEKKLHGCNNLRIKL